MEALCTITRKGKSADSSQQTIAISPVALPCLLKLTLNPGTSMPARHFYPGKFGKCSAEFQLSPKVFATTAHTVIIL